MAKSEGFTFEQIRDTKCGFCGKGRDEVASLIIGLTPEIAICDRCTEYAHEIVDTGDEDA